MDLQQVTNATAAWTEAWLYGNARPEIVIDALLRLAAQYAHQPQALVVVQRGWSVVGGVPFGSIQPPIAA